MLRLLRDEDVIQTARQEAETMLTADPDLVGHPVLRTEIERLLADDRAEYLEKT
nr:hypothetical protein GCM10020093_055500 [Planobispora longispora]